jgi:protease I
VRGGHDLEVTASLALKDVRHEEFAAIHVPGGAEAGYPKGEIDLQSLTSVVRAFAEAKKPVFAICMGVGILARTGALKDVTATCDSSTVEALKTGGGKHVDQPLAVDGPFVTSRFFPDLPHFCREMMMQLRRARPLLMITGPGFEDIHVRGTFWRMQEVGFRTALACPDQKLWEGKAKLDDRGILIGRGGIGTWGVPEAVKGQDPDRYIGLVLPGGKAAVDVLKGVPEVVRLVQSFVDKGLPVVAIGEGVDLVRAAETSGKRRLATERDTLVVDGRLVTAWNSDSLPGFWAALETCLRKP